MSPQQKAALDALKAAKGNKTEAAKALGISRSTLRMHLRRVDQKEIETDPVELSRAKAKLREKSSETKELLRRVEEAEARQSALDALHSAPRIPEIKSRGVRGKREAVFVALASDWHLEEVVYPDQVAGVNEYNLTIAEQRARRFFAGIWWLVQHHRQSFDISTVLLWIGGDIITGYIHEELEETNPLSPIEAMLFAKGIFIAGIDFLLSCGLELKIPCSFGNHGRVHKRKRLKTGAQNSFEWLLYRSLEEHYQGDPRVEFVVDKSAHQYVDVYGFKLHFHHGDDVRYAGGVGGVSIPLNKRVAQWDRIRRCDYHNVGHFHQFLDGGIWMVNGSLIGYSEFAFSIGGSPEAPIQGTYLIDSKRGKTMVSPLWVDEKVRM